MGGNAHKHIKVDRLTMAIWSEVATKLKIALMASGHFEKVLPSKIDPEKTTHGDLDILVLKKQEHFESDVFKVFASVGLCDRLDHSYIYRYKNGVYQVDINVMNTNEEYDLLYFCQSYGDIGMILPYYLKPLQLCLTRQKGLSYVTKLPISGTRKTYTITTSVPQICYLLGLDYPKWQQGFSTRTQIFEWLAPIEHGAIHPQSFRKYDKREMLQLYIDMKQDNTNTKRVEEVREKVFGKLAALTSYQTVLKIFDDDIKKEAHQVKFKEAFNGNIVTSHLLLKHGVILQGPALGRFMSHLRAQLDGPQSIPSSDTLYQLIDKLILQDTSFLKRLSYGS